MLLCIIYNRLICKNVGMHKDIKCLKLVINHSNIHDHRQVNSRVFYQCIPILLTGIIQVQLSSAHGHFFFGPNQD